MAMASGNIDHLNGNAVNDANSCDPGDTSTVEALIARFPKQWMVIAVTESDQYGRAAAGILLGHSPYEKGIQSEIANALDIGQAIFVFYGAARIHSFAELSVVLDKYVSDMANSGR